MSSEVELEGLKVGCMDLPCTEAGPMTRSLAVIMTGVNQSVLLTTLLTKRQPWLITQLASATEQAQATAWVPG